MNKKFAVAWLIVFVVWFFGSFVVHGMLLHADYAALPHLFRDEAQAQQYFPWMILAHILMSGALVWIYSYGVQADKPWAPQGVRFGIAIVMLNILPLYLIYYAVQPMPGATVVKQIVFDSSLVIILGLVTAFLYRNR